MFTNREGARVDTDALLAYGADGGLSSFHVLYLSALVSSEEELGEWARGGDMITPEGARIIIVHARHLLLYCEVELISAQVL